MGACGLWTLCAVLKTGLPLHITSWAQEHFHKQTQFTVTPANVGQSSIYVKTTKKYFQFLWARAHLK